MDKQLIIQCARKYIDTPYHHQARSLSGVDCIGLVLMVCWDLELLPRSTDFHDYARTPDHTELMRLIESYCTPTDSPEPGDLLVFRIRRNPQHVGIKSDIGVIHAYESVGKVVETPIDDWWKDRIVGSFILPSG